MGAGRIRFPIEAALAVALGLAALVVVAAPAMAADILFVSDSGQDAEIVQALEADGHNVTSVIGEWLMNDSQGTNPTLLGDLSPYCAVYWSASGYGYGDEHDPDVIANLLAYVEGGGYLFLTGYRAVSGDPGLLDLVGADTVDPVSVGSPYQPPLGPVLDAWNAVTTGLVDIRNVVPEGLTWNQDLINDLWPLVEGIVGYLEVEGEGYLGWVWTLRTQGEGCIAFVSYGYPPEDEPMRDTPAWLDTTEPPSGAGAYNAAVRNFAFNAEQVCEGLELTCPQELPPLECNASGSWVGTIEGFSIEGPPDVFPLDLLVHVSGHDPVVAFGALTGPGPFSIEFGGVSPFPAIGMGPQGVEVAAILFDQEFEPAICGFEVTVQDTTPPEVTCSVRRPLLWPPFRGMIPVGLEVQVEDCNPLYLPTGPDGRERPYYIQVWSDEPNGATPYTPDATEDGWGLRVRAERAWPGDGRVYLIRIVAMDQGENIGGECCTVLVPTTTSLRDLMGLYAQAEEARRTCHETGEPPAGFVLLWESPIVIGPI